MKAIVVNAHVSEGKDNVSSQRLGTIRQLAVASTQATKLHDGWQYIISIWASIIY